MISQNKGFIAKRHPIGVYYLVKVFAIATAFKDDFTFIVKYCPFTSTFGACSLSPISSKQKMIPLEFQTHDYPKRYAQNNFIHRMTFTNYAPK